MTGKQQIDYAALTQDALRGIVRSVLLHVAASGLPGEHHFFIAFDTRAPGVVLSKRLREKYPEEMTIVLHRQFSRLVVNGERFEVTLSFDNIPERLTVPLRAVRRFFDPSVKFIIHFEGSDLTGEEDLIDLEPGAIHIAESRRLLGDPRSADRDLPAGHEAARDPTRSAPLSNAAGEQPAAASNDATEQPAATPPEASEAEPPRRQGARPKLVSSKAGDPANDANVVELDKFRKK
jgi:hypothetical protein